MISLFIGLIIGATMGLTGAGGALVAIPLFMHFLEMTLKEASVFSLLAVVIASGMNFFSQRSHTNYSVALIVTIFSGPGSYLSVPYKEKLPDLVISVLLISISLYALYSVWSNQKKESSNGIVNAMALSAPVGVLLGVLTTFSGLGGGVLMMPMFVKFFQFSQEKAVATSLLTITLSSLTSLIIQVRAGSTMSFDGQLIYMLGGIIAAALLLKFSLTKLDKAKMIFVRQMVFTLVVTLAIFKVF